MRLIICGPSLNNKKSNTTLAEVNHHVTLVFCYPMNGILNQLLLCALFLDESVGVNEEKNYSFEKKGGDFLPFL